MTTLKGKTLFITGASRGIGLAIAVPAIAYQLLQIRRQEQQNNSVTSNSA